MYPVDESLFVGKRVLITGGTGTLGKELVKQLLPLNVESIRVYSRDEYKHHVMSQLFSKEVAERRLKFLLGDVRDLERLTRAMSGVQMVVHAAAMKHVPFCETDPLEAINTNVLGTTNVIKSALTNASGAVDHGITHVVYTSTDKAAAPLNLYGTTKLLGEKLITSSNFIKGEKLVRFSSIRYGNVFSSRGSVIESFGRCIKNNSKVSITDREMNRYNMMVSESAKLVLSALSLICGGEVFVPRLPVFNVADMFTNLKEFYRNNGFEYTGRIEYTGLRPGEKLFETLITRDEAPYVSCIGDNLFVIKPNDHIRAQYAMEPYFYPDEKPFSSVCYDCSMSTMKPSDFRTLFESMKDILL